MKPDNLHTILGIESRLSSFGILFSIRMRWKQFLMVRHPATNSHSATTQHAATQAIVADTAWPTVDTMRTVFIGKEDVPLIY